MKRRLFWFRFLVAVLIVAPSVFATPTVAQAQFPNCYWKIDEKPIHPGFLRAGCDRLFPERR